MQVEYGMSLSGYLASANGASPSSLTLISSWHRYWVGLCLVAWKHPTTKSELTQSWGFSLLKNRTWLPQPRGLLDCNASRLQQSSWSSPGTSLLELCFRNPVEEYVPIKIAAISPISATCLCGDSETQPDWILWSWGLLHQENYTLPCWWTPPCS